jgi:hypothetical protein
MIRDSVPSPGETAERLLAAGRHPRVAEAAVLVSVLDA